MLSAANLKRGLALLPVIVLIGCGGSDGQASPTIPTTTDATSALDTDAVRVGNALEDAGMDFSSSGVISLGGDGLRKAAGSLEGAGLFIEVLESSFLRNEEARSLIEKGVTVEDRLAQCGPILVEIRDEGASDAVLERYASKAQAALDQAYGGC